MFLIYLIGSYFFPSVESYPSEQVRADLSVQLGLTDRQLQMWFCHRRLKDRKTPNKDVSSSASPVDRKTPPLNEPTQAIAFVEAQLGEPLRPDGPILGMEFDPLPPGAFGAPIRKFCFCFLFFFLFFTFMFLPCI